MMDAFAMVMGLRAIERARRAFETRAVPEPEFRRFVFPERAAALQAAAPSPTPPPRTLEELGIPRPFAAELEATFRAMGALEGGRVTGFRFRAPDGVTYPLRAGRAVAGKKAGKAA